MKIDTIKSANLQEATNFKIMTTTNLESATELMEMENRYGAQNYHPLPVVICRGRGVHVWDVEGTRYYDFLSAYSAVNQGHCHPKIVEVMQRQVELLTLTSRAFYNDLLGKYEKYVTEYFGFDKVLPMNTGAEAVETAIKLCRKWAYEKKHIPENEAQLVVCDNNFHGRTTTIVSFSNDATATTNFGPYTPGFVRIPYNDLEALDRAVGRSHIAGFLVEPIQGEAGVMVPDQGYIQKAREICKTHNVLFIADEIQTGIGRTGALLRVCGDCSCEGHCEKQATYVKPDVLILGKALSGGAYPVSAVLADEEVMSVIRPGEHGSTFGGNPLAAAVGIAALEVLGEEKLTQNARKLGEIFRKRMNQMIEKTDLIRQVRGKGLLNALLVNDSQESTTAWDLCVALKDNGLLAKPTHGNIIRFAPPLVINEKQLSECCDIIEKVVLDFKK